MPVTNIGDVEMYYHIQGEGVPIVFVHPPLLTSKNFYYQVNELSSSFKVIVFDIRGHGYSSPSNKMLTYPLIAEDIKKLMDHLDIKKAFVCGYSTGGSIVLEFLLNYPECSLGGILIGTMSEVDDVSLRNKIKIGLKFMEWKLVRTLALSVSLTNSNTKQLFKHLYNDAKKGEANNIEQYYRYSLHYNCTNSLHRIHSPVLLLYGEKDKAFHRYARLLQEKLPVNEYILIGGAAHQLPTKAATMVNKSILKFVSSYKFEK